MPTPTASVKVNPLTGALIDPIAATFASANGFLTGGTSDAKESVVCATTANGTLATAFENGDTVDGIVLATGNRILIKNQSAPAENGIYTVNASGAPTRATDFDSWTEIVGAFVSVESGTVNAGTQWLCNVVSGGTLGTTAINFVVPQNYVNLTLNQIVGGNKHFATGSTIGGVEISKDTASPAVNGSIQFLEDNSIFALSANAGALWVHTTGDTDVTFPLSGTLLSTADLGVSVQAYDADLTTWAGITPGTNVGTGILSRPIFATTATAAGTTTFTVTSASTQEFTGSTTQTVTMPVVTTLVAGWATSFINKSTGNVTLNSSGGNAIVVLAGGQSVTLVCKSISADTTAAAWDVVGLSPALWFASKATATLALPDSTDTTVTFPTSIGGNATGWFNGTTITAGLAGYLTFEGVIGVFADSSGDTSANAVNLGVSKNGTTTWIYYESTNFQSAGANDVGFCLPFSHTIACADGDTFLVRINYADGGTGTVATALRTLKVSFSP